MNPTFAHSEHDQRASTAHLNGITDRIYSEALRIEQLTREIFTLPAQRLFFPLTLLFENQKEKHIL
jgi:hypothetical protein